MSRMRKIGSWIVVAAALAISTDAALASPTACYYGTNTNNYTWGTSGSTSIKSGSFKITNSSRVCAIYGWQDTGTSRVSAQVEYTMYSKGLIFDTNVGRTTIVGNYGQYSPTWYYYTFTGLNNSDTYYIEMVPKTSTGMNAAGNGYDGY